MWAYQLIGPGRLKMVDTRTLGGADLRPGEVLVRTLVGGICGSDIPKFLGRLDSSVDTRSWPENPTGPSFPGRPGRPMHETVGEVIATADDSIAVGCKVVGWTSNGLAEMTICRADGVHVFDPALSPEEAILLQPLACIVYALRAITPGDGPHAVIGVGSMGALFGHLLKHRGADRVIGIDPLQRGGIAERLGFDEFHQTTSDDWASNILDEDRPRVVVEAVGHQIATLHHALAAVRPGGLVYLFGFPNDGIYPIDMLRFMDKGLTLVSSRTRDRRAVLGEAEKHLLSHRELTSTLLTHRFERDDAQRAYDLAVSSDPSRLKVTIRLAD